MSYFLKARVFREDVNICISSIDYHCYPIIRFENILETFKQLANLKSKDSPSQHAHLIFFTQGHKLYFFKTFYQPSDLLIAQVVTLPRVRSAVLSVGTLSKAVPPYGSFSFTEASGVELWGASIFTVRQRLPEDHQSSTYFVTLNFSFQETPSERPSADGAPHYDFEQGKARTLSEFTEVSGEGAGKFIAEFKSFRLSCRYDFEYGQALNLLQPQTSDHGEPPFFLSSRSFNIRAIISSWLKLSSERFSAFLKSCCALGAEAIPWPCCSSSMRPRR
jgi:hypothetical protein